MTKENLLKLEQEIPAERRAFCKSKCCNAEVKNRFYGSQVGTSYGIIQEQSCSQCGEELETVKEDRVILKELAAAVFEEEEKTDIERLEERVKKLEEALKLLVGILKVSPQSQHFSDVPSKVEDYFKTEMEYLLEDLKS